MVREAGLVQHCQGTYDPCLYVGLPALKLGAHGWAWTTTVGGAPPASTWATCALQLGLDGRTRTDTSRGQQILNLSHLPITSHRETLIWWATRDSNSEKLAV